VARTGCSAGFQLLALPYFLRNVEGFQVGNGLTSAALGELNMVPFPFSVLKSYLLYDILTPIFYSNPLTFGDIEVMASSRFSPYQV
jgi:hypothetical protein